MAVKHIKTSTGLEIDIDEDIIDDMELFDAIADLQNGNVMMVPTVISKVCGEQKKALYDHCRNESGRVPAQAVSSEIAEIFEELNAKKS